ncbi:hypothetical protein P5673_019357 [Acropora cervicornis]|uniref:Uncharacterized protein n=1 Tax=Acropora cervicornis TaxID=6130 RepID=A0AAD9QCA3_ACRCE|nr:hypothetical protein P5673_019357 [Acropora cervicornis]
MNIRPLFTTEPSKKSSLRMQNASSNLKSVPGHTRGILCDSWAGEDKANSNNGMATRECWQRPFEA